MKAIPKTWTDEDAVQVAKLIGSGLTFEKIAEAFGVTKNAMISFVKRRPELEALNRVRTDSKKPQTKEEKRLRAAEYRKKCSEAKAKAKTAGAIIEQPKPKPAAPIQLPVKRRDDLQAVGRPLSVIGTFECRWAVNDAERGQEHLFCGSHIEAGSRYCPYHKTKAFGTGTFGERTALQVLKKHAA